ncbi:MAG: regulatory iron-sulfur-containing complex subunit RicT [Patescibacteria group bacterium]|nr:regulatory iron-sulfur-containing complex subunit RicT [Patescibacteria group bacterium]
MIVRFFKWDQPRNAVCSLDGIRGGNKVVVEHEWGMFIAEVLIIDKSLERDELSGKVLRKATPQDLEMVINNRPKEKEMLIVAKKESRALDIFMKIINVSMSLDGSCAVISFVADGRVDFRRLVKNLSAIFGKSIRLQQIGSRDEARMAGGYGICGRELCCKKFPGSLTSISIEMARCQFISHRGSERISGLCGRLMCCLSFEAKQYQDMLKDMPMKNEKVKINGKKGIVTDLQVLSKKVKIKLEDDTIILVDNSEVKRKALQKT